MRPLLRAALAASLLLASPILGPALGLVREPVAHASVSIAVTFDALVRESSSVAVVTPVEQKAVWEGGRIYTYTRVHADTPVAGEALAGGEAWVRTLGGVVGDLGQMVDGEPVLTVGRPSLLFLRPGNPGTLEVTARAQGQFPVTLDETRAPRLMRSGAAGALLPPRTAVAAGPLAPAPLAREVLHGKPLDEGLRDIAAAFRRLHASK
jgi:hypothetical protein